MRTMTSVRRSMRLLAALALAGLLTMGVASAQQQATGVVYHDANQNATRDAGEAGLANIPVCNGRDIVLTDDDGRYAIEVDDDDIIFVIKPRNWMVPVDDDGVPRFYYIHKPEGSPELRYPGVEPTGDLPESVDFPLYSQPEPDQFKALIFGDPQPRNEWEIDMLVHDVLDPIAEAGTDAIVAFTLGDNVSNPLDLLDDVASAFSVLPVPTYYVPGNHDENYDATADEYADETWERVFGPATYSLNYGPVHFIILDDVIWHPETVVDGEVRKGRYTAGITDEQLQFLRNDLALVPKDTLVVYMFHIPVTALGNRDEFLALFDGFENVLGLSAHTHTQYSVFVGEALGWPNETPHQHLVAATSCGAWWGGEVDEYGIPVTPCRDNVPNGHLEATFEGNDYSIQFVPARRPRSHQMLIWAPQTIEAGVEELPVYANVFLGNERSAVEMRVDGGDWVAMDRVSQVEEEHAAMLAARRDEALAGARRADQASAVLTPKPSPHLWFGAASAADLEPGYHSIDVRTTDMYGSTYHGQYSFRVR